MVEEVLRIVDERNAYFWATPAGAELDLLVFINGKRVGIEIKYADAPRLTKSMRVALHDLRLEQLLVVYPGATSYPLGDRTEVVGIHDLADRLARLARRLR